MRLAQGAITAKIGRPQSQITPSRLMILPGEASDRHHRLQNVRVYGCVTLASGRDTLVHKRGHETDQKAPHPRDPREHNRGLD